MKVADNSLRVRELSELAKVSFPRCLESTYPICNRASGEIKNEVVVGPKLIDDREIADRSVPGDDHIGIKFAESIECRQ